MKWHFAVKKTIDSKWATSLQCCSGDFCRELALLRILIECDFSWDAASEVSQTDPLDMFDLQVTCGPGFHWWPYPSPWVSLSSIVGSSSLALELWEVYSIPRYSNQHCCIAESKLEKTWSPNGAKNCCAVCTHIQSNQDKVALKI